MDAVAHASYQMQTASTPRTPLRAKEALKGPKVAVQDLVALLGHHRGAKLSLRLRAGSSSLLTQAQRRRRGQLGAFEGHEAS